MLSELRFKLQVHVLKASTAFPRDTQDVHQSVYLSTHTNGVVFCPDLQY